MNVAMIAHDQKKNDIVYLAIAYQNILKNVNLYATGTTGLRIAEATGLHVHRFQSGPYGGDQQIGAMIANNEMDFVVFLRDPLTAQPHDPDISALLRLCDVHNVPVATNMATAEALIRAMDAGLIDFKPKVRD
ncbi:methylglyoxal synthase [Alicyclobacillus acidoterrestris]|uniref:Methylglyoxal synthase n=1 Tax=Alicyclobacillus acidoterrestris (strain ATCC 49025 / DSM 3922 / CIP 106132 / NCIMB 13137 / GD3B) TaxID=1356854 RepID=T0CYB0_ALIAG|nr:methylglyoxal synthase [Alicyclobacillus acidoterrestris]EPZ42516.1 methylglyoxal synthase [Alicyclobacillus acidoterrestris ATCC 49025]UNO49470.1 methylglyoxal synthase [Alicyclobacillus acidoterrestris]